MLYSFQVNAIAVIFNTFLGNVALSVGRIAAVVFGIPLPTKQVSRTWLLFSHELILVR